MTLRKIKHCENNKFIYLFSTEQCLFTDNYNKYFNKELEQKPILALLEEKNKVTQEEKTVRIKIINQA